MSGLIVVGLHELVWAMDRYADRELSEAFGADFNLLRFLGPLLGGRMDVTRLAESNGLTKAAVSKRLSSLRAQGWVTTSSDPANARRVLISLTDRGREFAMQAGRMLETHFCAMLVESGIDPELVGSLTQSMTAGVVERMRPASG